MTAFKKGQSVSQVLPAPISGVVESFAFDPDTAEITVLVSYTDSEGNEQKRYFSENQLVAAKETAGA